MSKHYVGEIGTDIIMDTDMTITGATAVKILVQKPDGTEDEWTGSIDGTQNVKYTLTEGDFDQAGVYKMQAYVVVGTQTFYGETYEMYVYEEYE